MCVRRIVSRSLTEAPCARSCFFSVSSVELGPGSTMARWPSDSSNAVPMDFGRPIQLSSRMVILCMEFAGTVYRRTLQSHCWCGQRIYSVPRIGDDAHPIGEGGIAHAEACHTRGCRARFDFLRRRVARARARSYFGDDGSETNRGRRVHAL